MKHSQKYFFIASTLALLFVFLGYVVKFYDSWLIFDGPFQTFIRGDLPASTTAFFKWLTQFANPLPISLLTAAMMLFFYWQKEKSASLWLGFNMILGSGLSNHFLKLVYQRPRPTLPHLVTETSFSFPSGHATAAMIFLGSLIFLMSKVTTNKVLQKCLQVLCGGLILLIGLSRIYLGVHFPSDILGGYLWGATWLFATYPFYLRYAFVERFKNPLKKQVKK